MLYNILLGILDQEKRNPITRQNCDFRAQNLR